MTYGHRCAADSCEKIVPSDRLMCKPHWFKVPKDLRDRIWAGYRDVTIRDYDVAVQLAIEYVARVEAAARG